MKLIIVMILMVIMNMLEHYDHGDDPYHDPDGHNDNCNDQDENQYDYLKYLKRIFIMITMNMQFLFFYINVFKFTMTENMLK